MTENIHNKCIVCDSLKITDLKGFETHHLIKCRNCGFVFMKKIPGPDELKSLYNSYIYNQETFLSPITVKRYHSLLDEFEKFRKTNKLLDIGCGVGYFLEIAKGRGWEVYGNEYSATAIDICQKKGLIMKIGELNINDFEQHHFDIITSFEVLEHLNNPAEYFKPVKHWLRKDGLFYCTTPNFNSLTRYYMKDRYDLIAYPEHLSYFTKKTLNKLMISQGFKLIKFRSTGFSLSRLKISKGKSDEKIHTTNSSDEIIRRNIEKKWYMFLAGKIINFLLNLTNTGMTLKGYYIKK